MPARAKAPLLTATHAVSQAVCSPSRDISCVARAPRRLREGCEGREGTSQTTILYRADRISRHLVVIEIVAVCLRLSERSETFREKMRSREIS